MRKRIVNCIILAMGCLSAFSGMGCAGKDAVDDKTLQESIQRNKNSVLAAPATDGSKNTPLQANPNIPESAKQNMPGATGQSGTK